MFSGIIEENAKVLSVEASGPDSQILVIYIARPRIFDDLNVGDSIAVDGVCLTVEAFDAEKMRFTLGPETLKITNWSASALLNRNLNLERSLRLGDRIHGHIVSGHVDTLGKVELAKLNAEVFDLILSLEKSYSIYFPKKSSWAVAGVSLTINEVTTKNDRIWISSCLIPETLKRTNLATLRFGQDVNVEIDFMTRTLIHSYQERSL